MTAIETISAHRCFDGTLGYYKHASAETKTAMKFAVYVPPQAAKAKVPALYFLAGLTCTEETFMIKAGAQRFAAEHGIMLVACDTSPRGLGLPGEDADWDFGTGAGFYLDATAEPWAGHYRMFSYVNTELPAIVEANFPALPGSRGISGHSMGGHGALTIGLRAPERWRSISAFAPISNPVAVPWGEKAFGNYLGPNRAAWKAWDASELMRKAPRKDTILVDQGMSDQFLTNQLHPQALEQAAVASGQKLVLNRRDGYDHSYWFIQSFVADHIAFHAKALTAA